MIYRLLADLIVIVHLLFILFVLFGGLLALWRSWVMWLHIPAFAWGLIVEFLNKICPLTPLENRFRFQGGEQGYSGGFIEHYIEPIIYPPGLTPGVQAVFGIFLLLVNIAAYSTVWRRFQARKLIK